ncbi:family 43 glycosylhydrolase [Paenibacillus planticolens]|uniref:Family 43 glycosylhydrolase n=1 Tax=Paenibacillus planticolens TaxID=2654976 RepID=A0ABX1ZET2_9BACL|nr:family 43 glycosylhydrolase [Paenibacillus planticolens]NOU98601.1 family 43 glycosylhydrolase [Paenibacillus planticolens]
MFKKLMAFLLIFTLVGNFSFFQQAFADTPLASSDKGDGTYTNPVIWADVPDQDVIRVGDAYYMSSTTMHMNPGVPIMKSYDLINWETISYCYLIMDDMDSTTLKNNQNMYSNGTWASSLRYKNGTFYVVVPSPTTGKTYIFQTEDPENQPWRKYEINTRYHDCSLLLDDDGRNWLVYGNNPLYIIEMNETVTGIKPGATPRVILSNIHAPDPITGITPTSGLAEGAHIQKIDGKYYIFCITWPSGKPRTEVVHRSDSLNGPFEAKTVAQENINGGGPAQGNIVDDGKGNWYGILFRDSGSVGRIPWVMPIQWSNGWPMFGDDDTGLHLTRSGPKPIQGSFDLKSVVYSDEFYNNAKKPTYNDAKLSMSLPEYGYNGSNLNLAWQWNHNPDNRFWSLTDRTGWLRLTTGQMATNLLNARNTLTQRTFGPTSSAQTALDVSKMKNGDRAGLSLFTARYGTIEVRMDNDAKTLVMVNSSSTTSHTDVQSIPLSSSKVYLKVDADFRNQTDKGNFYYSLDGLNWTQLGNTQQMSYSTTNHFMGYRFALYNYATTTLGGYVDFDYFRISDELKGATAQTPLGAAMSGATGIAGVGGTKVDMPLNLDPLPEGTYSEISASFSIPSELKAKDVVLSSAVTGKVSWNQVGNQLTVDVTGSNVSFNGSGRSLFATVKLEVADLQAAAKTVTATLDYVKVKGGKSVYDVTGVSASFGLLATESGSAWAKVPGYSNPLITHKYGADPFVMEYNGRIYIYMTDDQAQWELTPDTANSYTNCRSVLIISSDDMVNWTDHGKVPVGRQLADGLTTWASNAWAPAAAHKTINGKEKFFLYFADSANGVGVLEADSPIGPFHDPLGKALISRNTPNSDSVKVPWLFDPAVFVDDDGKAYLYYGGGIGGLDANNPKSARAVQLGDDMISIVGTPQEIDAPRLFEDSGIHKFNGKYYYSYCSNFSGTNGAGYPPTGTIAYMVSDSPLGPFKYIGPILPGPGVFGNGDGGNNHHAIFTYKGKWYIIYHTRQVNIAQRLATGKTGNRDYRSPSITQININADGTITPLQMERQGVSQLKTMNPFERIEGETIGWNSGGISTKVISGRGEVVNMALTNVTNGSWHALGKLAFGSEGAVSFNARIASGVGGTIELHLDSLNGPKVGELIVPAGDGKTFQDYSAKIDTIFGTHDVFFKYVGTETQNLLDIDYLNFEYGIYPVEGVTLDQSTLTVKETFSKQLIASIVPKYAYDKRIIWTSDNPTVATVSDTGVVTGVSVGEATITATTVDGSFTAQSHVNVIPRIAVTAISLDKNKISLQGKATQVLTVSLQPLDADNKMLRVVSSNPAVATVSSITYNPAAGTASVTVESVSQGTAVITATAADNGMTAESIVEVEKIAPKVTITSGTQSTLPTINLKSNVVNDGLQGQPVTVAWSLVSGPASVIFENPNAMNTKVTVTELGEYTFKLIARDGELTGSANVTVTVNSAPNGGGNAAWYKFDETSGAMAIDSVKGNNATIIGATGNRVSGKLGNALQLQSASSQYANLPEGIVSDLNDFTVALWVNPATMATWARIFDFGKDQDTYMFLTLRTATNNLPRFAIKVNGSAEQTLTSTSMTLSANAWYHIAITKSGNTARMYINGNLAATNTNMTFKPSDMGLTKNNYIGKSQYSADPYLNGTVDEFSIFDSALSADQIKALTITSIPDVAVTTVSGVYPMMPESVSVVYSNSPTAIVPVVWDAIAPSQYAQSGTFTINGTVAGTSIKAKANVTVEAPKNTTATLSVYGSVIAGDKFESIYGLIHVKDGILAQDITISFDPAKVQFLSAESLRANFVVVDTKVVNGKVRILAASLGHDNGVNSDGPLLKIQWKALAQTDSTSSTLTLSDVSVANGETNGETKPEGTNIPTNIEIIYVNKTVLNEAISNAQSIHDAAVEGNGNGQYPAGAKAVLQAAIESAKAVAVNTSSTQAQIDQAYAGLDAALQAFKASVIIVTVDKSALNAAIADAQSKYNAAVEGTGIGQYPAGSKAALQAAIDSAQAVAGNASASQQQVDQATSDLSSAVEAFLATVNTRIPGDLNGDSKISIGDLAVMAKWYGKSSADPDWNLYKHVDLNGDGKIDIEDLAALARLILNAIS